MSRLYVTAGVSFIAACGSVPAPNSADANVPTTDVAMSDASVADAAPAMCDPLKPFAPPVAVPGLASGTSSDVHATLPADELTLYFASNRTHPDPAKPPHIFRATRASRDAAFGTPMLVTVFFSTDGEENPTVSRDGNTLIFDQFRSGVGNLLFASTRPNAGVVFPAATMISEPGQYLNEPSLTADGSVLYVANLQNNLLARLERNGDAFGPPQHVEVQTTSRTVSPVSSDNLSLFMAVKGVIHVTRRASTSDGWPAPTEVAELKESGVEMLPSWVSEDGCRLYLTYTPSGMPSRIYVATRPK